MLLALLGTLARAPVYWWLVPAGARRTAVTAASVAALACWDVRLAVLLPAVALGLWALVRRAATSGPAPARGLAAAGIAALVALFSWNKLAVDAGGFLPSQGGLVFLGASYIVLKGIAALVESARGTYGPVAPGELFAWLVFLPTYPAGPIEPFEHFRPQLPTFDRARALGGLERVLFGLVKALVVAHALGEWSNGVIASPDRYGRATLLLGAYGNTLHVYFDFSGYSDVAIGLAAILGWEIQENFDNPLVRRNLVQLWQHWHMTLTNWLRLYLFIPVTRALLRRDWGHRTAAATGQLAAMIGCGLWHGFTWGFVLWGALQAVGLVWVGILARDVGRRLPPSLVAWWRSHPIAYALSTALTFNAFALSLVFAVTDPSHGWRYLARLVAG
jgi:alginate O-acetyltransferase complex protein AlgI